MKNYRVIIPSVFVFTAVTGVGISNAGQFTVLNYFYAFTLFIASTLSVLTYALLSKSLLVRRYDRDLTHANGLLSNEIIMHKKTVDEMKLFRKLLDRSNDAIFVVSPESGRILDMNDKACNSLGYDQSELAMMSMQDIKGPVYECNSWPDQIKTLQAEKYLILEDQLIRKDDSVFPVELSINYVHIDTNSYVVAIARDISDRKTLEDQLIQSQKMESVGQLAGGIAHDFNNILAAITNYAYLLKDSLPGDPDYDELVDTVMSLAERASNLIKSLLAFSRKQVFELKPVNLNNTIGIIDKIIRNFIGEDIEFKAIADTNDLIVMADENHIEQCIINLATNARDAMPQGGRLTISTASVVIDKEFIKAHGFGSPGKYALISASDTGTGIDEITKQKIFEPFFTTKGTGKGTGLGLSMIYGITKQHRGYVDVSSKPGEGTSFSLYFPLIQEIYIPKKDLFSMPAPGNSETILLAEDEEDVRNSLSIILENSGYRVVRAVDGDDAIVKFKEHADDIRLLLLDVIMPKKNGKQAYEEIRQIQPGIKKIYLSGYTADILDEKECIANDEIIITKPVLPDECLTKIQEVIQG